ncbi:MAG TPA: hypothetical protein VGX46_01115, partial [Vicinamibacterales bacterium]|nr:hypothetical protein [Vicinamibacterales bacterium]
PIYIAAIIEGEIYYSKVCADAIGGRLYWPAVLACGALGGATGDQIWFTCSGGAFIGSIGIRHWGNTAIA